MRTDTLLNIRQISTQPEQLLTSILQKSAQLGEINQKLHSFLPKTFQIAVTVGNLSNNVLVLLVDSPTAHSQLRFKTGDMLTFLRQNGFPYLIRIDIKTRCSTKKKPDMPGEKKNKIERRLSDSAHLALRDLAENSPKEISEILNRMCETDKRKRK